LLRIRISDARRQIIFPLTTWPSIVFYCAANGINKIESLIAGSANLEIGSKTPYLG